jgi:hypothetical protein
MKGNDTETNIFIHSFNFINQSGNGTKHDFI